MLARVSLLLPYPLHVPENARFQLYEWEQNDVQIMIKIPARVADLPEPDADDEKITVEGAPTFRARALVIDFHKPEFDRAKDREDTDPPLDLIFSVANGFLARLRHVVKAPFIKPLVISDTSWGIRYLNNDETELPQEEGKFRGRFARSVHLEFAAIAPLVWEQVHEMDPDRIPAPWMDLLYDAIYALPDVGSAVVLSFTALETLVAWALDELEKKRPLPVPLWGWINSRRQGPAVHEQYDSLLKALGGRSLKEENELWEALQKLKEARNSFAHAGIAEIGKAKVTAEVAHHLIVRAMEIARFVRDLLPAESRWPEFEQKIEVQATKLLLKGPQSESQ